MKLDTLSADEHSNFYENLKNMSVCDFHAQLEKYKIDDVLDKKNILLALIELKNTNLIADFAPVIYKLHEDRVYRYKTWGDIGTLCSGLKCSKICDVLFEHIHPSIYPDILGCPSFVGNFDVLKRIVDATDVVRYNDILKSCLINNCLDGDPSSSEQLKCIELLIPFQQKNDLDDVLCLAINKNNPDVIQRLYPLCDVEEVAQRYKKYYVMDDVEDKSLFFVEYHANQKWKTQVIEELTACSNKEREPKTSFATQKRKI